MSCCSIIGNAPSFLSALTRGEIVIPSSLEDTSLASITDYDDSIEFIVCISKCSSNDGDNQSFVEPALCVANKSPVVVLFSLPTTSGSNTASSFLNFLVYSSDPSYAHLYAGEIAALLWLY